MSGSPPGADTKRGPIAWMARNPVAANLLMASLLIGGLMMARNVKQEVFPSFELDVVSISVSYPGSSPSEVEQGIVLVIEEAVRGLDGVKEVTSRSSEGLGTVSVELLLGTDQNKALADIKNAVDRIRTFPLDAERPIVSLVTRRREVISLIFSGPFDAHGLRNIAEKARDELLQDPDITQVELSGAPPPEISIEISREALRTYGLTLEAVAAELRRASVELPGGGVKTDAGEVLLRVSERRLTGQDFEDLILVSRPDGTELRVRDVARVIDGFRETDESASFEGQPAIRLNIYRVGEQTPIEVAAAVKKYVERVRPELPPGMSVVTWNDRSEVFRDRVDLLLRNAYIGLVLVFVVLGIFLEPRVAFWVTMGIPISFLGAFLFLPAFDASINMVTLFAFIVTLGMVVDDAIVIGENVYDQRKTEEGYLAAAVRGARQVATPVTFSILTTVAAFMPLFFVSGLMGKIFKAIPAIVIPVLLISLIESVFVLPAHLGHRSDSGLLAATGLPRLIDALTVPQQAVSRWLESWIQRLYGPVLKASLRARVITIGVALATLILTIGWVVGGRISFTFMPKVESDVVTCTATLPYGAPVEATRRIEARLIASARQVLEKGDDLQASRGLYSQVGSPVSGFGGHLGSGAGTGGHIASVQVFFVNSDQRDFTAATFASAWREALGPVAGLDSLTFKYTTGPSQGADITVRLSHEDLGVLEQASSELAAALTTFNGVTDVDDGFTPGKPQLDFQVTPAARSLGVSATDIGRQLRSSFYGAEAVRQQRGREELRVLVRLPEAEHRSEYDVEELLIRTPKGGEVPVGRAADVVRGRSYTQIRRAQGRRVVEVTADIAEGKVDPNKVRVALIDGALAELTQRHGGLRWSFEGQRREMKDSLGSLKTGFIIALVAIFALLAIPFRSYLQPLLVMSAIPFGIVGAVWGHVLMGFNLSLISIMGIVALAGVVVNDSLVLVDAANQLTSAGLSHREAIQRAGQRRFRPIFLTSITTFFGLAPMIFETSVQARFLVPMALSLGFGVLFSTLIVLLLIPSLYLVLEDLKAFVRSLSARVSEP